MASKAGSYKDKHEKGESKAYEAAEEAAMKKTPKQQTMTVSRSIGSGKKISGFTAGKKGK
jgi:hypothetical protein